MTVLGRGLLRCTRLHRRAACTSVVADILGDRRIDDNGLAVGVGYDRGVADVIDGRIVGEGAIPPVATGIARADIAVAIVDAAVEPDPWPPVSRVPHVVT